MDKTTEKPAIEAGNTNVGQAFSFAVPINYNVAGGGYPHATEELDYWAAQDVKTGAEVDQIIEARKQACQL